VAQAAWPGGNAGARPLRASAMWPLGRAECRARWAADLSARHRTHGGQLNNHACWRRNLLPGLEAEHKFTLSPGADICTLAI